MGKNIMERFRMDRISAVDSPAQKGANAVIMKRNGPERGAAKRWHNRRVMEKLGLAGDPEKAELFDQAIAEQFDWDNFWKANDALRQSVQSILKDPSVARDAKQGMIQTSLKQYESVMMKLFDGSDSITKTIVEKARLNVVCDELSKFGYRFSEKGDIQDETGGDSMALKDVAKKLGLNDSASETEIIAAIEKADAARATGEKVLKLSAEHRAYYDGLSTDELKATWLGKTDAERTEAEKADKTKKKPAATDEVEPDDDEDMKKGLAFKSSAGRVLRKADFGGSETAFDFAKGQAKELADTTARLSKSEDARDLATFTKSAEALPYIAKSDEVGVLLHSISKLHVTEGPKLAKQVEALFTKANAGLEKGGLFTEIGKSGSGQSFGKAANEIEALAAEYIKTHPGTIMPVARDEVRKANPEIAKREQTEMADAKSGAKRAA